MSWNEKIKEFGGGNFTFLSTDAETITFIVVGEPVKLQSNYKGKAQDRVGCPVVTDEGYQLFITGKRLFRKLAKQEPVFGTNAIMVIRHGVEGDVNSRYDVRVLPEPETFNRLKAIKDKDFTLDMIQDSIDEAISVLSE